MSTLNIEEANASFAGEETHSLDGNEIEDVNSAATSLSTPITSEEVARQIRAATDCLTEQLEKLCDLMLELRRETSRHNKETYAPIQGPSRPGGERFDTKICLLLRCISSLSKDIHKIRRDFVVCYQNLADEKVKFCKFLDVA